jgi:hypothetical protein
MTGQSFATSFVFARSQGATSLAPAFVGALTRFPIPSLIFTVLLARREREAQTQVTGGVPKLVQVPNKTGAAVTDAADELLKLGLAVTMSTQPHTTVTKGIVISQSIMGTSVPVGTSVNLVVSLGSPSVP